MISFPSHAADKLTITINKQIISAYRTANLENAKKEAAAAHKPIAWIATTPKVFDDRGIITLTNPASRPRPCFRLTPVSSRIQAGPAGIGTLIAVSKQKRPAGFSGAF